MRISVLFLWNCRSVFEMMKVCISHCRVVDLRSVHVLCVMCICYFYGRSGSAFCSRHS